MNDFRFYKKIDSDPTLDFTQKIMRALEAMHARGHIDDKTMEYLTPEDPKPGVLGICTSTLCLISELLGQ
jgi:hypothetical protein